MAAGKFQQTVYVTIADVDEDCFEDLLAWREQGGGVEDDGPTRVAEYKLVEVREVSKQLVVK